MPEIRLNKCTIIFFYQNGPVHETMPIGLYPYRSPAAPAAGSLPRCMHDTGACTATVHTTSAHYRP